MEEIEEAITKVIAGPEKKSRVISADERKLTAFHEAGHAVVAHCLPKSDPVHQITIVPRGMAGGFTMILPKEDKYYGTKEEMREQIIHLLGGRAAEKLTLDDISTGASNDIQRATEIARDMVTKYGFSEKLGPVNYSSSDEVFLGKDFTSKQAYSEETANEIDEEVKAIVEECYDAALSILEEHKTQLTAVAEGLLEIETLDGEQFIDLFDGKKTPQELGEEHAVAKEERKAKDKEEAKAAAKKRKLERQKAKEEAERRAQDKLDELSDMIEEQGKNAKFKPRIMTYNDMTQEPQPLKKKKKKSDEEEPADAEFEPVETEAVEAEETEAVETEAMEAEETEAEETEEEAESVETEAEPEEAEEETEAEETEEEAEKEAEPEETETEEEAEPEETEEAEAEETEEEAGPEETEETEAEAEEEDK